MKKMQKTLALVLTAFMLVMALAGCGGAAPATTPAASESAVAEATPTPTPEASESASAEPSVEPTPEALKQVELNVYLLGPEPKDMASIAAEINRLATEQIQSTVKWTFLGWDKWDQKYQLALASGEAIDVIYTANWANYLTFAKNGAYMDLTELAPKYAPISWASLSEEQWNQTKVGGKIYTVPCDWKEYATDGIAYRADVAKSLGFAEPLKTIEDIEKFLDACKAADPTSLPYNCTAEEASGHMAYFTKDYNGLGNRLNIYEDRATGELVNYASTAAFKQYADMTKRWYDKGFWSKNILSSKITSEELFKQGKNMASNGNPTKIDTLFQNINKDHPDWELGFVTYASGIGRAVVTPSIRNGMALPKNSTNPERALMLIDKLRYDPEYYNLTEYGIQGKHYVVDSEGYYVAAGADVGFGYMAMQPWGWHVTKMELPTKGGWPGYKTTYDDMYATFAFDSAPVSGEAAAIGQVRSEYWMPVYAGKVKDVQKAIDTALAQEKTAGIDKFIMEVKTQLDVFKAEQAMN